MMRSVGERTALTAHERDHAKRAAIVAAVLHLEVGASAFVGGIEDRRGQKFRVSENVGNEDRGSRLSGFTGFQYDFSLSDVNGTKPER